MRVYQLFRDNLSQHQFGINPDFYEHRANYNLMYEKHKELLKADLKRFTGAFFYTTNKNIIKIT